MYSSTHAAFGIPEMKNPGQLKSGERGGHSTGPVDEEIFPDILKLLSVLNRKLNFKRKIGVLIGRFPLAIGGPRTARTQSATC
jgi:hypothetical protein